jgi:hypothetical protein
VTTQSEYVPFRIDTSKPPVESERMALFYIDEKEYTGPVKVSAMTAMKSLEWLANRGPEYAAYKVMIECIGQEAFDALANCAQLEFADAQKLVQQISDTYYGQARKITGE